MKKFCFVSVFPILFSLQACIVDESLLFSLNNEEIILINPDGSGSYSLRLDLKDFFEQVLDVNQGQNTEMYRSIVIDTTIGFNNALANNQDTLTENERIMFKDGSALIDLNVSQKKGVVLIKLYFQNSSQLAFERNYILDFVKKNIVNATMALFSRKGMYGSEAENFNFRVESNSLDNTDADHQLIDAVRDLGKTFNLQVTGGRIENKLVDLQLFEKKVSSEEALRSLKEKEFLRSIFLKTTYVLTRPLKSSTGPVESISGDKKTITLKNSFWDLLNNPRGLEYSIDY